MKKIQMLLTVAAAMILSGCSNLGPDNRAVTNPAASNIGTSDAVLPASWLKKVSGWMPKDVKEIYSIPDDQLNAMPRLKAMVQCSYPCGVILRTDDGRHLWIGGPFSRFGIQRFMESQVKGQVYLLPDEFIKAFEEYKRQAEEPSQKIQGTP